MGKTQKYKQQIVLMKRLLQKRTMPSLSKDITNSIQNYTFHHKNNLNDSETLEIGGFK